jgi:hypothetical protein
MPTIDYEHKGVEREYEATTYTLFIYEQEFKGDLIKDVFGRIDVRNAAKNFDENGNMVAVDYTIDNWMAELRAFWAMLKTSEAIARRENRTVAQVPSFVEWCLCTSGIDMGEISQAVFDECQRGLFHAGAAASE